MYPLLPPGQPLYLSCRLLKPILSSQIADNSTSFFTGASANPTSAPISVNPECGILKAGADGSLGNIANTIVCVLSMVFVAGLVAFSSRRKSAVGEFPDLFVSLIALVQWSVSGDELML